MGEPSLPVSGAVAIDDSRLREMGAQLEEQFARSHPAMVEVLTFWAMVEQFQAEAERVFSTRVKNPASPKGGRPSKPTDLKNLFEKYAPNVSVSTAYKYHGIGRHIAQRFSGRMPEALLQKASIPQLALLAPKKLEQIDRRLPKKKEELIAEASGASKKSWLDEFIERKGRGGKTYDRGGDKGKRAAFEVKAYRALCVASCAGVQQSAGSLRQTKAYRALNHSQLVDLIHALDETKKDLQAWFDKPAADRDLIFAQQLERIARAHSPTASPARTALPKTKKKK